MKRLLAVLLGLALAFVGTMAAAAWLTTGSASATATATTVNQAEQPTVGRGAGVVSLSWAASTLGSGAPVGGYRVIRHHASDAPVEICVTTSTSCTDASPVATEVSYGVVATIGTSWRGPESPTTSFTYDDTDPVTTAQVSPAPNAASWNRTAVTVILQATDPGSPASGVDHLHYVVDSGTPVDVNATTTSFPVSGAGTHTVLYQGVDKAGRAEQLRTLQVKIDPDAPSTAVLPNPVPVWSRTDVTLSFSATDSGSSGIKSVTVDGTPTSGATASKTLSTEGTHQVQYFATDNADNVEATKSVTVQIDKTDPTASISPAGGDTSWTNDNTVALTAGDALSGVASTQYALGGGSLHAYTGPVTLAAGTNQFRYVVTDNAGNVTDRTATIKVDTVKPTAALTQSGNGQPTVTGSDAASGVASVSWRDGGSGAYTTVSGSTATLGLSSGSHTIWYYATDNAGNQSTPASQAITVDVDGPTITNLVPQDGAMGTSWGALDCTAGGSSQRVCADVTDPGGVSSVTMTLRRASDNKCYDGTGTNAGDWQTTCPQLSMTRLFSGPTYRSSQLLSSGYAASDSYTVTITATDSSGNVSTATTTFVIDSTVPSLSNFDPADNETFDNDSDTSLTSWTTQACQTGRICADASDSLSGIASVTYTLRYDLAGNGNDRCWTGSSFTAPGNQTCSQLAMTAQAGDRWAGPVIPRTAFQFGDGNNWTVVVTATNGAGLTTSSTLHLMIQ